MDCPNTYGAEAFSAAVVLALFAIVALIFAVWNMRRSVLGQRLLDACAGDYQTACLAIENTRADTELACKLLPVQRRRWFMRDCK